MELMTEIWEDIPDYPGYRVSNFGRVLGKSGVILKPVINWGGYERVSLHNKNGQSIYSVHRLILECFCPTKDSSNFQVNHKDGNKRNNHIDNLEWCSCSENIKHSYDVGIRISQKGEVHGGSKLTQQDIGEILTLLKGGEKQRVIAGKFGVDQSTISYIKTGRLWSHLRSVV